MPLYFLIFCAAFHAFGQPSEEKEVQILSEVRSKNWECTEIKNGIISKEDLTKLRAVKDCSALTKPLAVDFENYTFIGYRIKGDCFVSGSAKVFRSDAAKKYTVRIRTSSGGCRAAGSYQRLVTIEKIPADYKVEFSQTNVEKLYNEWNEKDVTRFITSPLPLEIRSIDMKGCIQTIFNKQFVIRDEATYLKTIRSDASRDYCLKNLEKIDFSTHTLLGIDINSGYCRYSGRTRYRAFKFTEKKEYLLDISYIDPRGSLCRADERIRFVGARAKGSRRL